MLVSRKQQSLGILFSMHILMRDTFFLNNVTTMVSRCLHKEKHSFSSQEKLHAFWFLKSKY